MSRQRTRITEQRDQTRSNHASRRLITRLQRLAELLAANIVGIENTCTRTRYAILLLDRLIFLNFIQKTGLCAGDPCYFQRRLAEAQAHSASFYRTILLPTFMADERTSPLPVALTRMFTNHTIEQAHPELTLLNEVFASIFACFAEYDWQIDELSNSENDTITPEILGRLFIRDAQAKELGTYYTPDAITAYMARNTLLPALFTRCLEIGAPDIHTLLWQQLTSQPARYLFPTILRGCELPLPEEIAAGYRDSTLRQLWQQAAPRAYALPGEIWRDVIARREHVDHIIARCSSESPESLARLVTWNLDQAKLALEMLRACQQPELLCIFYLSLRQFSVLDPTCGTGAFLRAVLAHLEPLYLACLARIEEMLTSSSSVTLQSSMRRILQEYMDEAGDPAQRQARVRRWIVEHNLYGVDLSEEAIEVCRLYLCLKILAAHPNHSPDALPCHIGDHLRVGNSLLSPLYNTTEACLGEPNIFAWDHAFSAVMARGGFDVVLGNPPYVKYEPAEQHEALSDYMTLDTGNLYALTIERSTNLLAPGGWCGMIVPSSATCTDGYRSLQTLLLAQQELHIASFSDQRGRLFHLAHPRLCMIFFARPSPGQTEPCRVFSTPYIKPGNEPHINLFEHLHYTEVTHALAPGIIPRYGSPLELSIHAKLARQAHTLGNFLSSTGPYPIYYTRKLSWFVQVTPFIPLILDAQGQARAPSELKTLRFAFPTHAQIAFVALNSNLFYWLITTGSDCRNLNKREVQSFPLDLASLDPELVQELCQLSQQLAADLRAHSCLQKMTIQGQGRLTIQCMHPARSKSLINEIDRLLARHYALSAEELDFLLHYDEKYRCPDIDKRG